MEGGERMRPIHLYFGGDARTHLATTSSSAFKFDLLSGFHNVKSTLNQTEPPTERKT